MNTHFVGGEEVDAYLRDLASRLQAEHRPTTWFAIGPSGGVLTHRLFKLIPSLLADSCVVPVNFNRDTKVVSFESEDPGRDIMGKHAIVLDSAIHSGSTMLSVVKHVQPFNPASVASYSLVIKRSSSFIPTYWGVMMNDYDRAYFLLDKLPNNRLSSKPFAGHLRLLCQDDLGMAPLECGEAAMDRITWSDRWYDMRDSASQRSTYILEVDHGARGYVTVSFRDLEAHGRSLRIDEVAVCANSQKKGFCSILVRWAETIARQSGCSAVTLWAIQKKIDMYEHLGYKRVACETPMELDGEPYEFMEKRIVYHISHDANWG